MVIKNPWSAQFIYAKCFTHPIRGNFVPRKFGTIQYMYVSSLAYRLDVALHVYNIPPILAVKFICSGFSFTVVVCSPVQLMEI